MLAEAFGHVVGRGQRAAVAHDQAAPMQTTDAAGVVAPRDPPGPGEFCGGEGSGQAAGERGLEFRPPLHRQGSAMRFVEKGQLCVQISGRRGGGGRGFGERVKGTGGHQRRCGLGREGG